mmetsp:Transcript_29768/g.91920  ORF Transcript_29768/g.91920 Transcript_29768/m.91920 type:complete len:209 (+) Transcript_29768:222-848(+)
MGRRGVGPAARELPGAKEGRGKERLPQEARLGPDGRLDRRRPLPLLGDRHHLRRALRARARGHRREVGAVGRRRGRDAHGRGRLGARARDELHRDVPAVRSRVRDHRRVGGLQRALRHRHVRDLHAAGARAAQADVVAALPRLHLLLHHADHARRLLRGGRTLLHGPDPLVGGARAALALLRLRRHHGRQRAHRAPREDEMARPGDGG